MRFQLKSKGIELGMLNTIPDPVIRLAKPCASPGTPLLDRRSYGKIPVFICTFTLHSYDMDFICKSRIQHHTCFLMSLQISLSLQVVQVVACLSVVWRTSCCTSRRDITVLSLIQNEGTPYSLRVELMLMIVSQSIRAHREGGNVNERNKE